MAHKRITICHPNCCKRFLPALVSFCKSISTSFFSLFRIVVIGPRKLQWNDATFSLGVYKRYFMAIRESSLLFFRFWSARKHSSFSVRSAGPPHRSAQSSSFQLHLLRDPTLSNQARVSIKKLSKINIPVRKYFMYCHNL